MASQWPWLGHPLFSYLEMVEFLARFDDKWISPSLGSNEIGMEKVGETK